MYASTLDSCSAVCCSPSHIYAVPMKYRKIEQALDQIIRARINDSLPIKKPALSPRELIKNMEKTIREIVEFHHRGETAANLPFLLNTALKMKAGGMFHLLPEQTDFHTYNAWQGCFSRMEVMITASLNALNDTRLIDCFNERRCRFDEYHQLAQHTGKLTAEVMLIIERNAQAVSAAPLNEAESAAILHNIAGTRNRLREIEAQYVNLKHKHIIEEAARNLSRTLAMAWKSVDRVSRKASALILNQVHNVFQDFKATKAEPANSQTLIRQKESLERYWRLFESIGDQHRQEQIHRKLAVVEQTLSVINRTIQEQKHNETVLNAKNTYEVENTYNRFLDIQRNYAEGRIKTPEQSRAALVSLQKCINLLKAKGRRVKAADIQRFIHTSGIGEPETSLETLRSGYHLYKRAFYILLTAAAIGFAAVLYSQY